MSKTIRFLTRNFGQYDTSSIGSYMKIGGFEALRQAPAVYAGSVAGNDLVIAAHNYRSHFSVLNRMVVGNEVVLTDPAGHAIRYVVRKIEVLQPTAIEEMTAGEWDLTWFTCTYGGKTRQTLRCERMT